ncbi:MAG: hypothetical protein A2992_00505 [Elusimicrobia bacterium RIFCSPLOWO2_01_FULL_59_12]|nr:MAG: hypothetical protein A2992_00505 [Elusimicrobia bacterium RIFCSPLOWO2_01_FULL_59_12]
MSEAVLETGSFRDRTARVFYHEGQVFRGLTESALRHWQALTSTRFYTQAVKNGSIVTSQQLDPSSVVFPNAHRQWAAVLQHETIPVVSYPYEWPFGMLRDAALLQLDLLLAALGEGMTLKDASPFNVQWKGAKPVFVDVASFQTWAPGESWVGYRQFCQMFLYPLMLLAYRGVPFHPWLRGSLEGIDAETCLSLMTPRDYLRAGVLTHVYLQARAQAAYKDTSRNIRAELRAAGFGRDLIKANAQRLRKLIDGLSWKQNQSTWSGYASNCHYDPTDAAKKKDFVRDVVAARTWNLVWDLGCNTGTFSRLAAERARYVIALDADHLAVERFYQELKREGNPTILPLVGNLADPSPDLGWQHQERKRLIARGRPDLVLCLALVHHLVIAANIPMSELLDWLAELGADLVIEFVTREDPMVITLLRNKDDQYADYDLTVFDREIRARFVIAKREQLASGTRVMYHARPIRRS